MQPLKIDLKTRTLVTVPQVYMVRPGQKYHLFDACIDNQVMIADAPFLSIADGHGVPVADKIAPMLERALAYRSWGNESPKKRGQRPSEDLDHYRTFLSTPGGKAKRTRLRNAADDVLYRIPDKSLIFIPAPSLSHFALLGEAGPRNIPRSVISGTGKRKKIQYPARKLERVKLVPMRDLPPVVTEPVGTISVVNEFEDYASERLLREYYGDYQRGVEASVTEFMNEADNLDSRVLAQMIALSMSLEHHMKTGNYVSPSEMIFGNHRVTAPKFHARVNSKDGKVHVETSTLVPHVLKSILLVAAATAIPISIATQALTTGAFDISNTAIQQGPEIVLPTQNALADYAASAGVNDLSDILEKLRVEIRQNEGKIDGVASY